MVLNLIGARSALRKMSADTLALGIKGGSISRVFPDKERNSRVPEFPPSNSPKMSPDISQVAIEKTDASRQCERFTERRNGLRDVQSSPLIRPEIVGRRDGSLQENRREHSSVDTAKRNFKCRRF